MPQLIIAPGMRWKILGVALFLGVISGIYAASRFAIDADVNKLISQELPWRKREAEFDKFFPPKDQTILAVVDAPTSELAAQATDALIRKLSDRKELFRSISEAGGGPFFQKNGLLFLPTQEVVEITKKLGRSQADHPGIGAGFQPAWSDHSLELRIDRRADEIAIRSMILPAP